MLARYLHIKQAGEKINNILGSAEMINIISVKEASSNEMVMVAGTPWK